MPLNKIQKSSLNPTLLLEPISIVDKTVANGSYDLDLNASYNYRILQVDGITGSGTCDVGLTIEGVNVVFNDDPSGTETAISMSSTGVSRTTNSAMDVALGDNVKLVITNNSAGTNLAVKVHIQRI